jgi:hypothetical protein
MISRTEEKDMRTKHTPQSFLNGSIVTLAALLTVGAMAGSVSAQSGDNAGTTRERKEVRDAAQDSQGDALRDRVRDRIENEQGLDDQERERLRQHLAECKQLGLDDETVTALFDESKPLRAQIRTQERIIGMAREGLPHEPVMQKMREGRRKGASEEALERVCARMEEHVRAAERVMERARRDGVTRGDPDVERRRTREMATQMWRGLNEEDGDQLCERARLRLRDGSCTTEDLTAAAETAAKLKELGIERHRAVGVAGEALQYGYTAREMRQLGWMVMTAHMHGGPDGEVLDTLERGIRNQHQFAEMLDEMWQHGWMGPADEHGGHGNHGFIDDATGGGPGGHEGGDGHMGDDRNKGGSGGQQHGGGGGQQGSGGSK